MKETDRQRAHGRERDFTLSVLRITITFVNISGLFYYPEHWDKNRNCRTWDTNKGTRGLLHFMNMMSVILVPIYVEVLGKTVHIAPARRGGDVTSENVPWGIRPAKLQTSLRIRTVSLRNVYSNILRILSPKNENFQMKNSGSFHISAQNRLRVLVRTTSARRF